MYVAIFATLFKHDISSISSMAAGLVTLDRIMNTPSLENIQSLGRALRADRLVVARQRKVFLAQQRHLQRARTMATQLETVADGLAFGECPRWHDGALWWSDMHDHTVRRLAPSGELETICRVEGRPSGLGWLPGGDLLVVSMTDRRVLRLKTDGSLALHADLSTVAPRRTNDMVVDRLGRAYIGNFGFDYDRDEAVTPTTLALVEPDGAVRVVADQLLFPNGMVITPDGGILVVAETWGERLTAFDIAADGSLINRRLWARLPAGVYPDGICLDAEGAIWVASPTANACLRVREGGDVTDTIATGRGAFACMLGGADRRTLYICTADSSDHNSLRRNRTARIEAVRVAVSGTGLP